MMKSRIICILLLLVGASGIYAQSLTVTGKVVSMVNTPLPLVIRRKMSWFSLLSDWKIWKYP